MICFGGIKKAEQYIIIGKEEFRVNPLGDKCTDILPKSVTVGTGAK